MLSKPTATASMCWRVKEIWRNLVKVQYLTVPYCALLRLVVWCCLHEKSPFPFSSIKLDLFELKKMYGNCTQYNSIQQTCIRSRPSFPNTMIFIYIHSEASIKQQGLASIIQSKVCWSCSQRSYFAGTKAWEMIFPHKCRLQAWYAQCFLRTETRT